MSPVKTPDSPESWAAFEQRVKAAQAEKGKMSKEAMNAQLQATVTDSNGNISTGANGGMMKVGQSFIGPILIRLKYEGIIRDLLVEHTVPNGTMPQFPAWDHLGMAYVLDDYAGTVRATRYEGKVFQVPLMRIATRARIPKGEVRRMNFDIVERTKQQMLENMMRREDKLYYHAVDTAILDYSQELLGPEYEGYPDRQMTDGGSPATPTPAGEFGLSEYSIGVADDYFSHLTFADAFGVIARAQLMPSKIVLNVGDYMDVFSWNVNDISYAAVERLVDTGVLPRYGMADFKPSVTCPKGVAYVQPDPQYVGFFPQAWSPEVQEDMDPSAGEYGWVIDESVGVSVVNPAGLCRIQKGLHSPA